MIRAQEAHQGGAGEGTMQAIDGGYYGDGKALSKQHLHICKLRN